MLVGRFFAKPDASSSESTVARLLASFFFHVDLAWINKHGGGSRPPSQPKPFATHRARPTTPPLTFSFFLGFSAARVLRLPLNSRLSLAAISASVSWTFGRLASAAQTRAKPDVAIGGERSRFAGVTSGFASALTSALIWGLRSGLTFGLVSDGGADAVD